MASYIDALLYSPALQPIWLLGVVMLVEMLMNWPERYHPLSFAKLVATRMADKVHPSADRAVLQQRISGTLAPLVLISPVAIILAIFITMAEFPVFFDGLLLLIALQYQGVLARAKKVNSALALGKKTLARQMLNPIVLRETDLLSEVGIVKATIESTLLRFHQQYLCTALTFLLFGPVAALCFRLVYEFSHCWNTKRDRFSYFGQPCAMLLMIVQWLPLRLTSYLYILLGSVPSALKAQGELPRSSSTHQTLLALHGGAMGIELSGPAIYEGEKKRSIKCGGKRQVGLVDIKRTLNNIFIVKFAFWVVSLCVGVAIYRLSL
ncbi:cobalamin biosynthesis protein [Paraglaciecola chathamensis]|uniref:cobalamin biosynthesis protein CobD/CbiB n=1 Tax=Paraglaciecola chathamensis TaxID=368405 RepID=UPI00270B6DDE|nr:cobalamin biosynthesis protein [Paraglaciecola chathamensis]MDO6841879.1 cobalamin biosynthesis protein [Paraglaciecola chathamensis]